MTYIVFAIPPRAAAEHATHTNMSIPTQISKTKRIGSDVHNMNHVLLWGRSTATTRHLNRNPFQNSPFQNPILWKNLAQLNPPQKLDLKHHPSPNPSNFESASSHKGHKGAGSLSQMPLGSKQAPPNPNLTQMEPRLYLERNPTPKPDRKPVVTWRKKPHRNQIRNSIPSQQIELPARDETSLQLPYPSRNPQ